MRILFVDDEISHATVVSGLLRTVLDAEVEIVTSVAQAVRALHEHPVDLVITDLFIPLGESADQLLGPRARRYREHVPHLGSLVLLDELDQVTPSPIVLAHTACTEAAVFEALGGRVSGRIMKPAGAEVMLRGVLLALGLPVPG